MSPSDKISPLNSCKPELLKKEITFSDGRTCCIEDLMDASRDIDSVGFVIYPKANTPGCTKQCLAFSERIESFTQLGVAIVGISTDSAQSQVRDLIIFQKGCTIRRSKHSSKITI